jgi:hypothetical protein
MAREVQEIKRECDKKIQEMTLKMQMTPSGTIDQPKEDPIEEFFKESIMPNNDKERKYLRSLLGNKDFVLTLLFSATKEETKNDKVDKANKVAKVYKSSAEYFH